MITFDQVVAGKQLSELKQLLYSPVNDKWKQKHPFIKVKGVGIDYIPVSQVETNLDIIFGDHFVEILKAEANDEFCMATVRVHVTYPDGTKAFQDGGAITNYQRDAQTEVEKATIEQLYATAQAVESLKDRVAILETIYRLKRGPVVRHESREAAMQKCISEAIKDAADHFGPIFGRDLNRKQNFEAVYSEPIEAPVSAPAQTQATESAIQPSLQFLSDL